jgi:hypothetical protein
VIIWGLAENAMNGAPNAEFLIRSSVRLGIGKTLADVDMLGLCDEFLMTHGAAMRL